jgi:hypothetical protein
MRKSRELWRIVAPRPWAKSRRTAEKGRSMGSRRFCAVAGMLLAVGELAEVSGGVAGATPAAHLAASLSVTQSTSSTGFALTGGADR